MEVVKRDGRIVQYDPSKVKRALQSAFQAVDGIVTEQDEEKITQITNYINEFKQPQITVEEIQDFIEHKLMSSNRKDIAKQYIIYRNNRTIEREKKSTIVRKVVKRINATNIENSNANVDERSFSGREKEAASDVSKMMAFDYGGLSKKVSNAHKNMLVYQHDAEKSILGEHNCVFENDYILYNERIIRLKELSLIYPLVNNKIYYVNDNAEVLGRNGYTKLEAITKRKLKQDELLYEIKLEDNYILHLTGNHRIPVVNNNIEGLIQVKDLQVGLKMYISSIEPHSTEPQLKTVIEINTQQLECEVYDLQTSSHWFAVNNVIVHNCLFADLGNLLKNGFTTRNGDVRPPTRFSTACQQIAVIFQCQSQV